MINEIAKIIIEIEFNIVAVELYYYKTGGLVFGKEPKLRKI